MRDKQQAQQGIPLPTKEMVTGQQLSNLLNVLGGLTRTLEGASSVFGEPREGGALDGGTKMATEASLAVVLNRIESIVNDPSRWDMKERDLLEKQSLKLVETHQAMLEEQTKFLLIQQEAAALVSKPSYRLKPRICRIEGGWCAFYGDPAQPDELIVALGASPEEALAAFDQVFSGQTSQSMVELVTNEKQTTDTLDAGTPGKTPTTAGAAKKPRRDSRRSGAKSAGGKQQNPVPRSPDPDEADPLGDGYNAGIS